MRIGITYDLRQDYLDEGYDEEETAEFDRPDTIEAIQGALNDLGFETDRIGTIKSLVFRLSKGDRWDLVFNIAEGLKGFGREAQVPALLDAYGIAYTFSDPLVSSLALHKGVTKRILRDSGIPTADFVVLESLSGIGAVDLPYPLFVKPVAEGTGKGITAASKVRTPSRLAAECRRLLTEYGQPVLVETFLPGREFTVGIVGTGQDAVAIGVLEILLNHHAEKEVYSYVNKERCEELVEYRLVSDAMAAKAAQFALAAWKALGSRDAGRVDLRSDVSGIPNVMEVNPLPGLHPEHSDLPILCRSCGIPYSRLIESIVQSAMKRLNGSQHPLGSA